jgi:uncharacterized protein with ATP-grasp and redox domains
MKSKIQQLEHGLNKCFDRFKRNIADRQIRNYDLDWLLDESKNIYVPDHFMLCEIGETRLQSILNRLLAYIAPKLWYWFFLEKFYKNIFVVIKKKFINQLFIDLPEDLHLYKTKYLKKIDKLFKKPMSQMRYASFTDLFKFLSETAYVLIDILNIDPDSYKKEKQLHNQECLGIYKEIKAELWSRPNRFELICYLALRANWIDCVEDNVSSFLLAFKEEINQLIDSDNDLEIQKTYNPCYHLSKINAALRLAPQTILYELDNCGEVILDLLFVEVLITAGHKVTLCTKKAPIINDVTESDLVALMTTPELLHLNKYISEGTLKIINNNSIVAGKYIFDVSDAYKQAYKGSTFVILKGQGNFQAMPLGRRICKKFLPYRYKKPIIYMMGVKANLIWLGLRSIFSCQNVPDIQSHFMYFFDPSDPETYPK